MASVAETIATEVRTWLTTATFTTSVTFAAAGINPLAVDRDSLAETKTVYVRARRQQVTMLTRGRAFTREVSVAVHLLWPGVANAEPDASTALVWVDEFISQATAKTWTNGPLRSISQGEDGELFNEPAYRDSNVFETALNMLFGSVS